MNSKVGEFNTSDISLAILVDGVKADAFPAKDSGKVFEKLECTNGGSASWDSDAWKLTINDISGPTECTISFGTLYADASGAEAPDLDNGMIPVTYDTATSKWVKADTSAKWYDYDAQWWANAVTVTASSRETYTKATANTPIEMSDIETMWVWIPRYEYQHSNLGTTYANGSKTTPGAITINFISKDTVSASSDNYTIHDAFWWDDNNDGNKDANEQLSGIWVAKFEMSATNVESNTLQAPIIKPNVTSWRYAQIGTMWTAIHQYMNGSSNQYGLINTDAHLMKNMEWGAVAYLSQSKHGKKGNPAYTTEAEREVAINNCSTYKTGIGGGTVSAGSSSTTCTTNTYETNKGQAASTTGNIYGIYDMSGGANEYVMGIQKANGSEEPAVGYLASFDNSGWSGKLSNGTSYTGTYGPLRDIGRKYYDLYNYGTDYYDYTRYHKGDATYEVANWYLDNGIDGKFVAKEGVFFERSGLHSEKQDAGVFSFSAVDGLLSPYNSGRPALVQAN